MRNRVVLIVAAATLVVVGLALAYSGSAEEAHTNQSFSDLSAAEIVRHAIDATANLKAVHLRTTADTASTHLDFDLRRTADGTCFGRVRVNSRTATVIFAEKYTYVRADATFWRYVNQQLRGDDFGLRMARNPSLWGRVQTGRLYLQFCDVRQAASFHGFGPGLRPDLHAGVVHTDPDGRRVVKVLGMDGKQTFTVSADEPHYVLEIGLFSGRTVLSEFGEPAEVTIPTEDEYLAYDDLEVAL